MEKRQKINYKEAKEFWKLCDNDSYVLAFYPKFEDFWEKCEKLNNLPEGSNQREERIENIKRLIKRKKELAKVLKKYSN